MTHGSDAWQKTFYQRAIQTSLGSALRAQYDLSQPMPDRLAELLKELDDLEHNGTDTEQEDARRPIDRKD